MNYEQTAQQVLDAVGGSANVLTSTVCMTRLRLTLQDPAQVDVSALDAVEGVLGSLARGSQGLEVVFRPLVLDQVFQRFAVLAHANTKEQDLLERPQGALRVQISPGRKKSYEAQATATIEKLRELANTEDSPIADEADIDVLRQLLATDAQDAAPESNSTVPAPALHAPATTLQALTGAASAPQPLSTPDAPSASLPNQTNSKLKALLDTLEGAGEKSDRKVLVLNGPNINMLGIREPSIYGHQSYADLVEMCQDEAEELGFAECWCYQSNHEGDLVDEIQHAYRVYNGIIFNPGAYTHTSIALLDALKAVGLPCVEVHISAVDEREDFRQISYIRQACFETITGLGIDGYRKGLRDLWAYLDEHDATQSDGRA